MAGTDQTRPVLTGGPTIVLVAPQLGENIGAAARAMANFGLSRLRIVAPRDGWPSDPARANASGADWVIDGAQVFDTTEQAIADIGQVYATTARPRDLVKPVRGPRAAARGLKARIDGGEEAAILFGGERAGLSNDDIALADVILTYPVNPGFASLNLAQAVLVMSYEWMQASLTGVDSDPNDAEWAGPARPGWEEARPEHAIATKADLFGLFEHLEGELDRAGFLKPPEKRPNMIRNLRNLWHRAQLTDQDVRTLRGMIVALTGRKFTPGQTEHPASEADSETSG
ncbi:MAG: RNA methyltransferase [Pseudomonadota bacterium]